jgi:hypothetical protein
MMSYPLLFPCRRLLVVGAQGKFAGIEKSGAVMTGLLVLLAVVFLFTPRGDPWVITG